MSCENQELKSLYITALILEGGIIGMCTVNLKTALVFGGFGWGQPYDVLFQSVLTNFSKANCFRV